MNHALHNAVFLAVAVCTCNVTEALAQNWMMAPSSVFEMYDADSIKVDMAMGTIIFNACSSVPYKLTCSNEPSAYRFYCKDLTRAYDDPRTGWESPTDETPGSEEGYLFFKLCTDANLAPNP